MKIQCHHVEQDSGRQVCAHLLAGLDDSWSIDQFAHYRRYTGKSLDYVLTCPACQEQPFAELSWVCGECFVDIAHGSRLGNLGSPEVPQRESGLRLQQIDAWTTRAPVVHAVPFGSGWAVLTRRNELMILESGRRRSFPMENWGVRLEDCTTLVAAEPYLAGGGVVLDIRSGLVTQAFKPSASLALTKGGQLIHGPQPNRLELAGQPLRAPKDYHQSGISLSPGGEWLAMNGWIRESMGEVRVLNIANGEHSRPLCHRDGFWDGPLVWLGPSKLGVAGLGQIDVMLLPGLRIFDLESLQELPSIPGPETPFAFDEYLFCRGGGLAAWDLESGQRLFYAPDFHPLGYHPGQKAFLSQNGQDLILSRLQ